MSFAFASESFGSASLPGAAGSGGGPGSAARATPPPSAHSAAVRQAVIAARRTRPLRVGPGRRILTISPRIEQWGQGQLDFGVGGRSEVRPPGLNANPAGRRSLDGAKRLAAPARGAGRLSRGGRGGGGRRGGGEDGGRGPP